MSHFVRGETALGAAAWDRALALSPNDTAVIRPIGTQLPIALGLERARQGVELVERALRLDPFHPVWFAENLGCPLYFAGRYAEAASEFEKVPNPGLEPRLYLAVSYAQAGEREKAAAQAAEILKIDPGFTAEVWVERDLYEPGSSSAVLFFEGARKASLPLCAPASEVASIHPKNRLPECEAERARAITVKS
jgi:adenylate cyclase